MVFCLVGLKDLERLFPQDSCSLQNCVQINYLMSHRVNVVVRMKSKLKNMLSFIIVIRISISKMY